MNKFPFGIDISDSSIEILQLNKEKELLAYSRIVLEEGIVDDGEISQEQVLVKKIQEVFRNAKPNGLRAAGNKAVLSLPESKIFVHHFELSANLQGQALEQEISKEAAKIVPFDPKLIYWDYQAIPLGTAQHITYFSSPKQIVDSYTKVMNQVGIEPIVFDVESAALSRALLRSAPGNTASMIVDIGARKSIISVFDALNILCLSVTIQVGGDHFTKDVEANLQKIVKEIREAITYYETTAGGNIQEIVLSGGASLSPKIDEYIQLGVQKRVTIGNPLQDITDKGLLRKESQSILFANVIGLALRGIQDDVASGGINLLPKQEAKKEKTEGFSVVVYILGSAASIKKRWKNIPVKSIAIVLFAIAAFVILGFVVYQYVLKST